MMKKVYLPSLVLASTLYANTAMSSNSWPPKGYEAVICGDTPENLETGRMLLSQKLATLDDLVNMGILQKVSVQEGFEVSPQITLASVTQNSEEEAPTITGQNLTDLLVMVGFDDPDIPDVVPGYEFFDNGFTGVAGGMKIGFEDEFKGTLTVITDETIGNLSFLSEKQLFENIDNLMGKKIIVYNVPGVDLPFCLLEKKSDDSKFIDDSLLAISDTVSHNLGESTLVQATMLADIEEKLNQALKELLECEGSSNERTELQDKAIRHIEHLGDLYKEYGVAEKNSEILEEYQRRISLIIFSTEDQFSHLIPMMQALGWSYDAAKAKLTEEFEKGGEEGVGRFTSALFD